MKTTNRKPTYADPYHYPKAGDIFSREQLCSKEGWRFLPSKSGKTATLTIEIDTGNGSHFMECALKRLRGGLWLAR